MKVQDVMTTDISYCEPVTNAAAAAEMMWNQNCGVLPVVEDGRRVVGIVTDRDLFLALGTGNCTPSSLSVGEIMNRDVVTGSPDDNVRTALKTMTDGGFQRLPIANERGELEGILSLRDVTLQGGNSFSKEELLTTLQAISRRHGTGAHGKRRLAT